MRLLALALTVALFAAGCSDSDDSSATPSTTTTVPAETTPTDPVATTSQAPESDAQPLPPAVPYAPGGEWETLTLEAAGFDPAAFGEAVALAESADSHCFLVLKGGRIVHESYGAESGPEQNHSVFSVTKSVSAAIVGAAETDGHLEVASPASDYLTEWEGTESESVTIQQVLQNTSGRLYEPFADLWELGGEPDMTAHSIALTQEREPDTAWFYNQSAIQTLEAVIERSTGEDVEEFAQANLFEPIGMSVEFPRNDADNIPMFAGLQAGCRDLARFALLSDRGGIWGEEEVISSDFMEAATTGRTDLNRAYGYLYWHNAEPGTWDHTNPGRDRNTRFWPDLPIDTFSANGLGEQFATVFPSDDLIVVRIGPPTGIQGYDGLLSNDLPSLVLKAFIA